ALADPAGGEELDARVHQGNAAPLHEMELVERDAQALAEPVLGEVVHHLEEAGKEHDPRGVAVGEADGTLAAEGLQGAGHAHAALRPSGRGRCMKRTGFASGGAGAMPCAASAPSSVRPSGSASALSRAARIACARACVSPTAAPST